jgi:diguanylate cyclase (GGDEF)-like protein/putative nucleotidyltransferase with HDIG domain
VVVGLLVERLLELRLVVERVVDLGILVERIVELGVLVERIVELGVVVEQRGLRRQGERLMSAAPGELRLGETTVRRTPALPPRAWFYFTAVVAAALTAATPLVRQIHAGTHGWTAFLILSTCAAIAQLFVVRTTRDQSYHTSTAFLIAGALLLPPELVVLMGVVQHIPEWLKHRYAWYIQTFNIANYTLDGLAAWGVARLVLGNTSAWTDLGLRAALAGLAASIVFVVLNHVLMAGMLYLARGHRPSETELFSPAMLSTELVLASLGIGVAVFWHVNPALIPFALAPLLLIHRSLHVPRLEEQARVDPKTGLFNSRHFAAVLRDELVRAERFERPASLIMADLDLLRETNNTYGHLTGDAVLAGVAEIFRRELRHYDVPARFGGEEFAILLPETGYEQALEIAERIRRAVADHTFGIESASEPVRVTISLGVASFPRDGKTPNELVHHADLAVYRAKLQGRNRVLGAGSEQLLVRADRAPRLVALPPEEPVEPAERRRRAVPVANDRRIAPPRGARGPRLLALSGRLTALVTVVSAAGVSAGLAGAVLGRSSDVLGMIAATGLVGAGQALALEFEDRWISVGAVGAITAAALFDFRTALAIAVTSALVDWSAHRTPLHRVAFNVGTLSLAALASAAIFSAGRLAHLGSAFVLVTAVAAALGYYAVNMGLLSLVLAAEGRERPGHVWAERFRRLVPHYAAFGFLAGVLAIAYGAIGLLALAVAILPLLLMRKTQAAYLQYTERCAKQLRDAAETIHTQNVSLEKANRLLRERSTAAMESLSATVDARDSHTAGHSRRVQRLALAIGREVDLSQAELDLLGDAALFHDIGKLAIPDSILMKPAQLDTREWRQMRRHADEGARIIDRLGFLADAVPSIRHHHERYDGSGYPDRLRGEEIPLGARIIHVADALDSMLTSRIYRPALTEPEALAELKAGAGTQFCPRCVRAIEQVLAVEPPEREEALAAS